MQTLDDVLKLLPVDASKGLVPYRPLTDGDLGPLEDDCDEYGEHNPNYLSKPVSADQAPAWAQKLRTRLRRQHGRTRVGRVICHTARCDGCSGQAIRYGVVVRYELGEGLAVEREYGEPK